MSGSCLNPDASSVFAAVRSVANTHWSTLEPAEERSAYPSVTSFQGYGLLAEVATRCNVVSMPYSVRAAYIPGRQSGLRDSPLWSERCSLAEPASSSGWPSGITDSVVKEYEGQDAGWANVAPEPTEVVVHSPIAGLPVVREVEDFASDNGLCACLGFALESVRWVFGRDVAIAASKDADPESDEEWITIDVAVMGSVDTLLDKYDRLSSLWAKFIPWPQRGLIRVDINPL